MARRRRSLLGSVARTAVITKTASRVAHNEAARAEAKRAQAQPQEVAPPQVHVVQVPAAEPAAPAAGGAGDVIAQLKQFAELRDAGILTEEEFAAQKAKLLGQ